MKTSSFLCGVLMGAVGVMMMSRRRKSLMSPMGQSNGSMGGAASKAKDKIMDMAMTGFGSTAANDSQGSNGSQGTRSHANSSEGSSMNQTYDAPIKSKEANLRMLKDFIRSNPEVKHEVEQILKETHTAIPGL